MAITLVLVGSTTIINVTPHEIRFAVGDGVVTAPPSGVLINAKVVDSVVDHRGGVEFVKATFVAEAESEERLAALERDHPDAIIVGSIIAAQAYPGRVVGMVAAKGYERVPVSEKLMRADRFTTF